MHMFFQHRNKARAFLLACFLASAFCAADTGVARAQEAAATGPLTLRQAIITGLETNPELASVSSEQQAAAWRVRQAFARYVPSVDMQAETGLEATDTPVIAGERLNRRRVTLTLTQLLFDGFGTSAEARRRNALAESAGHRTIEAAEFVALNIVSGFMNVLRRRELLKAAEENIADHEAILNRIDDGATSGKFNQADLAQVQSRLEQARANCR